jgi:hypothetical protein
MDLLLYSFSPLGRIICCLAQGSGEKEDIHLHTKQGFFFESVNQFYGQILLVILVSSSLNPLN